MTTTDEPTSTSAETPVETPVESGVSQEAPAEGTKAGPRAAARARIQHFVDQHPRVRILWNVATGDEPSVWSQPPATPAELVRYARDGAWCADESTGLRLAGRVYSAVVAIPCSLAAYLTAWVVQRPGRLAAVAFLVALVWLVL